MKTTNNCILKLCDIDIMNVVENENYDIIEANNQLFARILMVMIKSRGIFE